MKKILLAVTLLTSGLASFSQVNKGQWLAGGTAGFESSKFGSDDDSKTTSFTFSPAAGYFFINNFAGGLRASINSVKDHNEDAFTSVLFAPFVRYYFLPAIQKVNILADASYGFGSMKSGESESFNQFAIAAGPAVFLSPNTALEFTLQYRSQGGDAFGGDDRLNSFGVNVGFQVHLGK
jgi:Outer membrane protein beta-barrel domain